MKNTLFHTLRGKREAASWQNGSLTPQSLRAYGREIERRDAGFYAATRAAWNRLCKPLYALGRLEQYVAELSAIQRKARPDLFPAAVFCFISDNGIVAEGVSQCGPEVTAQVMLNMAEGRASVAYLAQALDVDVFPLNLGVKNCSVEQKNILRWTIRAAGTRNFLREPAMTREEMLAAIACGITVAETAAETGYRLLIGGEMGIGNTTTSTTLISLLLGLDPAKVTGRGSGLSAAGLARKKQVVAEACHRYAALATDALELLAAVGGFDIAALVGFYLGAAKKHVPVLLDGIISYAAALVASRLAPAVTDYLLASHLPREQCCKYVLSALDLHAPLDLDLALGEGAGALMLLPLLDLALVEFTSMPDFDEGAVEAYKEYN